MKCQCGCVILEEFRFYKEQHSRMRPRARHIFCFIVTFLLLRLMSLTPAALRLLNSLALFPLFALQAINLQLKTAISLSTCRMRKLSSDRVVTCAF